MYRTILFLCPHNAAKSVLAVAYCQHLAAQCGLEVQVTSQAMQYAAAALLVSSALRMVQAAAGGQWHGVGVTLSLGLFLDAYFLHLGPVLVVILAAAVGMLIL
jgi:hypothetical protein